ncbi:MAG: AMP-dependent synthetase/ligase [Fibrobacterales bacterium]
MHDFNTIPEMIQQVLNQYSNSKALNIKILDRWESYSTSKFVERIRRLALGFKQLGIQPGDGVGIISRPSPQWLMVDVAIMINKAVSIPMFHNISHEHFDHEVKDGNIKYLFIDGDDEIEDHIKSEFGRFKTVISNSVQVQGTNIVNIQDILLSGDELSEKEPDLYSKMRDLVSPEDIATIIYTSGSTGTPKGVVLTHQSLTMQIHGSAQRFPIDSHSDTILSCLPLAHVFERMVMYYYVSSGASIYFVDDVKKVGEFMKEVKPTIMTMVPRILEKAYAKILAKPNTERGIKKLLLKIAIGYAMRIDLDQTTLQYRILNKIVYSKIRDGLGGRLRMTIVGGAALFPKIGRFFTNIGVPVYQGYGLTECSPVIAANFPGCNKLGTVGHPFPNVTIKISDDGEVIAQGENLMQGYHNMPTETEKIIKDGWLHTGDRGSFDEDGFLVLLGRIKELFKTSTGKYVSPLPIEHRLCLTKTIEAAAVIADNRKFASCLIFPDFEIIPQVKRKFKASKMSDDEFINSKIYRNHIEEIIQRVNKKLDHWEQIQAFTIIPQPISIESGELTPTMKLRRHVIDKKFSEEISAMYPEIEV